MIRPRTAQSLAAEDAFRVRLLELGATLLEAEWLGAGRKHRTICAAGHECAPRPSTVASGIGICIICAGKDPKASEAAFLARLKELGAKPLYDTWHGTNKRHRARCAAGHVCYPLPDSVKRGGGICRTCAGCDPAACEARFRARLAELAAIPLYETWLGSVNPHRVRCAAGHECRPRPSDVLLGHDVCRKCSHRDWDAFYVVTSPEAVKFGCTSGDPRRRLYDHAAKGYTEVVRLLVGLPGLVAHDTELAIRAALESAGEKPLKGREYFDISCLALVLDVADAWLSEAHSQASIDAAVWRAECRKRARETRPPAGRKTCESCGAPFDAMTSRARYCSCRCINRATDRRRRERLKTAT